jgi:hypothetical protein
LQNDPADQIRQILGACTVEQRDELVRLLRTEYRIHEIEREWNTSAEVVLEALARANPLTKRMFKGILAEAACKIEIIDKLEGWRDVTAPGGNFAYDFAIEQDGTTVTVQAKLQRKAKHKPMFFRTKSRRGVNSGFYVVETQKTRAGKKRSAAAPSEDQETRPYRFGEFDILAVSMEPSTGDWSQFRFTVGNWLMPRPDNPVLMAVLQPVSLQSNDDWTDSLPTAIEWWRANRKKTIRALMAGQGESPVSSNG